MIHIILLGFTERNSDRDVSLIFLNITHYRTICRHILYSTSNNYNCSSCVTSANNAADLLLKLLEETALDALTKKLAAEWKHQV